MGEKMLITQALTEKETLQDEICRLIQESEVLFCRYNLRAGREDSAKKAGTKRSLVGMLRNCLKRSRKR